MRSLLILIALAASALSQPAAASECLPSASAVRQAHGQAAYSTWHFINGSKCWMEGQRHDRRTVSRSHADNRSARARAMHQLREVKEAELRPLFPPPLPPGCPQALINQAFAVLGMGR